MSDLGFSHFMPADTYFGGATATLTSTDGLGLCGSEICTPYALGTASYVRTLRVVKNLSGVTLYAKKLVRMNATLTGILGEAIAGAEGPVALICPELNANGCPANDLTYIVVCGPAIGKTAFTNLDSNVITAGDLVNAATINATSTIGGSTSAAGRLKTRALSSSLTVADAELAEVIGRAMSSIATSGQTNADVAVMVFRRG